MFSYSFLFTSILFYLSMCNLKSFEKLAEWNKLSEAHKVISFPYFFPKNLGFNGMQKGACLISFR